MTIRDRMARLEQRATAPASAENAKAELFRRLRGLRERAAPLAADDRAAALARVNEWLKHRFGK